MHLAFAIAQATCGREEAAHSMPRLHSVKPLECVRALEKLGFQQVRQTGSHLIMQQGGKGGRSVPVPIHKGHDIPVGTLSRIITQAGVSVDDFLDAL